jgi:hypothetical protein
MRVKATQHVEPKKNCVLGFVGGILMSTARHAQLNHPASEQCFSVSKLHLAPLNYAGPDLTVCIHERHNVSKYMRAPADVIATPEGLAEVKEAVKMRTRSRNNSAATSLPVQANVQANVLPCLYIDCERGVAFLILVAVVPVPAMHEFLVSHAGAIEGCEVSNCSACELWCR